MLVNTGSSGRDCFNDLISTMKKPYICAQI